jgi:hypothetical protein
MMDLLDTPRDIFTLANSFSADSSAPMLSLPSVASTTPFLVSALVWMMSGASSAGTSALRAFFVEKDMVSAV